MSSPPIVLVEDDDAQRAFAEQMLASGDRPVRGFADPRPALDFLARETACLLVADLLLPGMSGVELMQEARALQPEIKVLAITGLVSSSEVVAAFREGADYFLRKPFSAIQLREAVKTALVDGPGGPMEVSSPSRDWVEITCPSHEHYIERFERFCTLLHGSKLDEKTVRDIRIAVDEIGRNAVEWGNKRDIERSVKLAYCHLGDRIILKIEDEGEGFDHAAVTDPSLDPMGHIADREEQGKRPGGYGLFMVRQLFDEVFFNARGNIVILVKQLDKSAGTLREKLRGGAAEGEDR